MNNNISDKNIIDKINNLIHEDEKYFSYLKINRKEGIHSIAKYPATMVPKMQEDILNIIIESTNVQSILDPFMGSGTVIVESKKKGLDVYGIDLNPHAYMISTVKTSYYNIEQLYLALDNFKECVSHIMKTNCYNVHDFNNIDKWFKKEIIIDLSILKEAIIKISNISIQYLFWVVFMDLVTEVKNSRSSTFKLHIKTIDKIMSYNCDVFNKFMIKMINTISIINENQLSNDYQKTDYNMPSKALCLKYGDSKELMKILSLDNASIDLIVTSPPYGDNHSTVTYGQFSSLPLSWLDSKMYYECFEQALISNNYAIDNASLGGKTKQNEVIFESSAYAKSKSLQVFYSKLKDLNREDKARKVASFIIDIDIVFNQITKVLRPNGYFILVIGNRRVHDVEVPFDKIINELICSEFHLVCDFSRDIVNKKIATKVSKVNEKSVKSITSETILIFRKI